MSTYIGTQIHKAQKGEYGEYLDKEVERPGFNTGQKATSSSSSFSSESSDAGAKVKMLLKCM